MSTDRRDASGTSHPSAFRDTRLVHNAGWNLAGVAIPILAALASVPLLIHAIGDSRFGFLSIAWVLVGYFGLLDLGMGRAITYGVAKRLSGDAGANISGLVWTGLAVLAVVGLLVGVVVAVASRWLVFSVIDIPAELRGEAVTAVAILAVSLPFVLVSAGLRGALEAVQAFKAVNLVVMPIGALLYVVPVVVAQFSVALPPILLSLVILRIASCALLFVQCLRNLPRFFEVRISWSEVRELLSFGGWMTVSNVVSPLMVNMDRLFVGSLLSVSAVTYYVTPFEAVSKLLVIPSSIGNASFPEFSRLAYDVSPEAREATRTFFFRTLGLVAVLLLPLALFVLVFAHGLLAVWVSTALAHRSAGIMRLLAIGIVVNGLCYVPFAYIQGLGRSSVTAKFHLVELAVYVPTLYLMIAWWGLMGVAAAWLVRVLVDALLLFGYAFQRLRRPSRSTAAPGLVGEH